MNIAALACVSCPQCKTSQVTQPVWLAVTNKAGRRVIIASITREYTNMMLVRAQWPHTIDDITKALDGVWGVVGATSENGTLYRLERTLKEPTVYTFIEYVGADENAVASTDTFPQDKRDEAVKHFARAIGFAV